MTEFLATALGTLCYVAAHGHGRGFAFLCALLGAAVFVVGAG